MVAVGVEVLGEHVVVVAQHLVHPDLGGRVAARGRHGGGRGGGLGRRRRRCLGGRGRWVGGRCAGRTSRRAVPGCPGPVVGPRDGPLRASVPPVAVPSPAFSAGTARVVGGSAGGVTGHVDGVPGADLCRPVPLPGGRSLGVAVADGVLSASTASRRARRPVTGGGSVAFGSPAVRPVTPSTTASVRGGRAGHRQPHPEQPAAAAAYVVLGGHDGHADPAGQRVQLSPRGSGRRGRSSPSSSVGRVGDQDAVRSFSSAAEVWLFTVPGLTPRSAAVSSTERPQ